jgi:hypothetical protein
MNTDWFYPSAAIAAVAGGTNPFAANPFTPTSMDAAALCNTQPIASAATGGGLQQQPPSATTMMMMKKDPLATVNRHHHANGNHDNPGSTSSIGADSNGSFEGQYIYFLTFDLQTIS